MGVFTMKFLRKIGNFFVAAIPYWIFVGIQLAVSTVGTIILTFIEIAKAAPSGNIDPNDLTESILSSQSVLIISVVANIACIAAALIEFKVRKLKFKDISPVNQNKKVYIFAFVFTIGAFFVLQTANAAFLGIMGVTEADSTQEMLASSTLFTFIIALTAPFSEELVFRGLMVKTFGTYFSTPFSVIAITAAFMVLHSSNMKCYALLFGLVLMFLRYKFGDWKLCLVFHFTANLMSCLLTLLGDDTADRVMSVGTVVGLVIAAAAVYFMIKFANKPQKEKLSVGMD